jgi:zinc transport system ATP-binding protein
VIGYVPQKVTQLERNFPITVEEVVALGRLRVDKFFNHLNAEDQTKITEALTTVDLLPFRKRLLSELSGGQQQRVFIAKALAGEPKLLILDEPTMGIDIESQEKFYALLGALNKAENITIIIVSHDIDVIVNQVNSVLCLNKHLIYHGSPKNFLKDEVLEKLYGKNRKFIIHAH